MSTDRDVTRIVRSWLRADGHESADRVLEAVFSDLDTTPQRPASWPARRLPTMNNNMVRVGLAAAVLAGVAVVGLMVFGNGRGIGGPDQSSEAATPSPEAATLAPSAGGAFQGDDGMEPGTYTISEPFPVDIEFTIEEGWFPWTPGVGVNVAAMFQTSADPPNGRVIIFGIVNDVFADACDTDAGFADPGPTVEDLAAVLAGQSSTESTEPVDVTISGYSGLYLDYTNIGDCGTLQRWPSMFGNREALVGERDQVWILDVDGVRLVIDAASFEGTDETDLEEMRTIIESLTIQP